MDVEYDLNGNMTSFDGRVYTYDAENRLTDIDTGPHYAYDYQGRRISKTVAGVTTKYCYDGSQIIAEYSSAGTLLKKYIYGPGIDEPVCMLNVSGQNETKYYYHFDGLGSVIALSNASGNVVESYKYDVFGELAVYVGGIYRGHLGSVGNRFTFTGRELDNESGNYYYRARYYNPSIGRFLQPDPIGYVDSMNLYQYCLNNPVNFVDPSGCDVWVESHGAHKNINVGDPKGKYNSYSYRVKGDTVGKALNNLVNPFADDYHRGVVYEDPRQPGKMDEDRYLKTTPEQDQEMIKELENMEGEESGYDLLFKNNCRGFSDKMFDAFKQRYGESEKLSEEKKE